MREELWPIKALKNLGHKLLDEYIALEYRPWRTPPMARKAAYKKLCAKVGEYDNCHFGMMTTRKEVLSAIVKLRRMIKKRRDKIKYMASHKNVVAPNVSELQKLSAKLNKRC